MTKYVLSASFLLSLTLSAQSWTVQPRFQQIPSSSALQQQQSLIRLAVSNVDKDAAATAAAAAEEEQDKERKTATLTQDLISKLRFRELQTELSQRELPTDGTTGQLRNRLREAVGLEAECVVNEDGMGDDCVDEPVAVSPIVFDIDIVSVCVVLCACRPYLTVSFAVPTTSA